ncbi:MAG: Zn-ribbon domain-containing OB-fold protein [Candidatus Korarchaeota archaeon]|nr:Zn-ribbon domain-containing OB-fold protein [Candidatus Korarchaeota archaeon]NIU82841.1 transcriptional regulator [Candidatus Thorarchaeota archaeon]NIW13324.1 transcriptional regulator [Candidatus Thorarchaeota archaeon]NIW51430.1 transcriptional regulator [Candidatus Korarchaeota archaeon]
MTEKVPAYWRKLGIYLRFEGTKCKECGATFFPPREVCPHCYSDEMETYNSSREGKLISWSIVSDPPSKFEKYAPYILGLVELTDGNKIIAQLADVKAKELEFGMRVKAVVRRLYEDGEEGLIHYGYKFIPKVFPED